MISPPSFTGRRKPYTQIGISRVPCSRCGASSRYQWQVCANGNRWLGVCEPCDIELNRLALGFMRVPDGDRLLAAYVERRRIGPLDRRPRSAALMR